MGVGARNNIKRMVPLAGVMAEEQELADEVPSEVP